MITAMKSHEELLLSYQRRDDREALTRLVASIHKPAYRRALHLLGDPAAADDAVQEALIALTRGAKRFRKGSAFGPWWSAILRNAIRDEARKLKAKTRRDLRAGAERLRDQEAAAAEDRIEALRGAVASLPFDLREAIVLRYLEDRTRRDAARSLGVTERTMGNRLRRGLDELRSRMKAGCAAAVTSGELEALLEQLGGAPVSIPAAPAAAALEAAALKATVFGVLSKAGMLVLILSLAGLALLPLVQEAEDNPLRSEDQGRAAPITRRAPSFEAGGQDRDATPAETPEKRGAEAPGEDDGEKAAKAKGALGAGGSGPSAAPGATKKRGGKAAAGPKVREKDEPAAPREMMVRVVDEAGEPVAGAPVRLEPLPREPSPDEVKRARGLVRTAFVVTGRGGMAAIEVPATVDRRWHRFSSHLRDLVGTAAIPESGGAVVVLRSALEPSEGKGSLVVAFEGSPPRPSRRLDVELHALSLSFQGPSPEAVAELSFERRLDGKGQIYIRDLEEGRYRLRLPAPGEAALEAGFELRAGEVARVVLKSRASVSLEGELALPPGAREQDVSVAIGRGPRPSFVARVSGGRYRFSGLRPGRYQLRASLPGYPTQRESVVVAASENRGPKIALDAPGHRFSGRLSRGGAGVAGARVHLYPRPFTRSVASVIVDGRGRFCFGGLAPGRYQLLAELNDGGRHGAERLITIAEDRDIGELALGGPARLEVQVVDARGQPAPGAEVIIEPPSQLYRLAGGFLSSPRTANAEGCFKFNELWAGTATLTARLDGQFSAPMKVELAFDATARLRLRLDTPGASLNGRLLGEGRGGLVVRLSSKERRLSSPSLELRTDEEGRFAFEELRPGRYALQVGATIERELELSSGPRDFELDLDRFKGRLSIQVAGARGGRVRLKGRLQDGGALALDRRLSGDRTVLDRLPEGRFSVEVEVLMRGQSGSQTCLKRGQVELRGNLEARLEMRLPSPEDAAKVGGRPELPKGAVLVFRGAIEVRVEPRGDGSYQALLPPGRYRVFAVEESRGRAAPPTPPRAPSIELAAGQVRELSAVPLAR